MTSRRPLRTLLAAALLAGTALTGTALAATTPATAAPGGSGGPGGGSVVPYQAPGTHVPPPTKGVWFGVSIDWGADSLASYAQRLGHAPAVAVDFTGFPMSTQEAGWLDGAVTQARATGSVLLLTLEPNQGLDAVTPALAADLAQRLAAYNAQGVRIIVRFAHEMNGSWYAWGQQPAAYVAAFRTVADAVHRTAPGSAMMWAPNYGGGYPFAGGPHQAVPGSADAAALDTNGDGAVTGSDDPYAPYWPGRAYVDWVGMSLYHWGNAYPWGENEVPEAHKFTDLLRGTYNGANGDESAVPDFYATYAAGQKLPLAITETAALYVPGAGGAAEIDVKRGWWSQVLAPANATSLPWLKLIDWFEWSKQEGEVGHLVDWTATTSPTIRAAFQAALPSWLRYAGSA